MVNAKVQEHSTNSGGLLVVERQFGENHMRIPLQVSFWGAIACECQPKYSCSLAKHMHLAFCLFVRLLGAILQFFISNRLICNFFSPVLNGCHHPLYCASSTQLLTNASDQKCEPEQARMFKGLKVEGLKGVKDVRDQKVESAE